MTDQPTLFDTDERLTQLERDLRAACAEETRLRDLLSRYHSEEDRRRKEHDAAVRRDAWRTISHTGRHIMLLKVAEPFNALLEAVGEHECDDTAGLAAAVAAFNHATARDDLREDQIDMGPAGEIRWLRSYIRRAGQQLHEQFGDPNPPHLDRCRCVGCDLIVGTDLDVQAPPGAIDALTDLQRRVVDAENDRDAALAQSHASKAVAAAAENTVKRLTGPRAEADANRRALHTIHGHLQSEFVLGTRVTGKQRTEGAQAVLDYIAEIAEKGTDQ